MLQLLLLSNSTNYKEPYFEWAIPYVDQFLDPALEQIVFIPYAAVGFDYSEYELKINGAWGRIGKKVVGIHHFPDAKEAIKKADAIVVGGGNTWQLLKLIYENDLIEPIRQKVLHGTPYIGWSAGSNLACPSIKTTNDMPVVQPPSFDALNLIPFQINPHYTEATIPNHGGETRAQRIIEFVHLNKSYVVGLPEGCLLQVRDNQVKLVGNQKLRVFKQGELTQLIDSASDLQFLLK